MPPSDDGGDPELFEGWADALERERGLESEMDLLDLGGKDEDGDGGGKVVDEGAATEIEVEG